jgi:hypothetical protein
MMAGDTARAFDCQNCDVGPTQEEAPAYQVRAANGEKQDNGSLIGALRHFLVSWPFGLVKHKRLVVTINNNR